VAAQLDYRARMRNIAVIGSGQAGLLAAHGLLRAGYSVVLYSDRSPEQWLRDAHPTGTAVRFARSLAYERELGLDHGHLPAPKMDGLKVTICSGPARPFLDLVGRFAVSPLAIDVRLQSAEWMRELTVRGGVVVLEKVSSARIEEIGAEHDLTIVATGKEGGALFARDAVRSPSRAPVRHLAMVNCDGAPAHFADVPFAAAKFTVFESLGECYWTPYYHKDGRSVWNLVFEAKPGTAYDRFQHASSGEEVLALAKQVVREMMPWDAGWLERARLADPKSWLVGAITPTVRDPVRARSSARGGPIVPLGDAYMTFDPLGAQGANMGNRLAQTLVAAIVARGDAAFDAEWIRNTYDAFYERWGGPAMRWTHLLLEPMGAASRYMLLAQSGADGRSLGCSPKQALADAFVANFDDPIALAETLRDIEKTRRWVAGVLGLGADWHALRGFARVGVRRMQNAVLRQPVDRAPALPRVKVAATHAGTQSAKSG
jgi:2-polyprenyl-6-methoxyphenol hydroxylase-like FAD-dependent oxidoreductase